MLLFPSSLDDAAIKANNSVVLWPKSKTLLLAQLGEAARLERFLHKNWYCALCIYDNNLYFFFLSYKNTS